jgi:hypothetical protein
MTTRGTHLVALEQPPRRVFKDARAAFREGFTSRLLPMVGIVGSAPPSASAGADDADDGVVMFKDDDVVVFLRSRRVAGGSRLVTEVFGVGATTTATLRRPARRFIPLFRRRGDVFESPTVPTGPACLVIETGMDTVTTTWHGEWLTL